MFTYSPLLGFSYNHLVPTLGLRQRIQLDMQPHNSIHVDMLPLYHLPHTQVIRPGSKAVFNLLGAQLPAQKTRILLVGAHANSRCAPPATGTSQFAHDSLSSWYAFLFISTAEGHASTI